MRPPTHLGHERATPLILGYPNGEPAKLVEGTGLYLAVRKGDRRWVTGTAVAAGLRSGVLIDAIAFIGATDAPSPIDDVVASSTVAETSGPHTPPVPADTGLSGLRAAASATPLPKAPKRPTKKGAAKKVAAKKR